MAAMKAAMEDADREALIAGLRAMFLAATPHAVRSLFSQHILKGTSCMGTA